jgi:hypothetical protein
MFQGQIDLDTAAPMEASAIAQREARAWMTAH